MEFICKVILVYSILLYAIFSCHNVHAAELGEFCNETNSCANWMTCNESGKCQCADQHGITYDTQKLKCVSKVEGPCQLEFADARTSAAPHEIRECGSYAKCSPTFTCLCQDQFYATSDGTCAPTKNYGEVCQNHEECLQDAFFQCIDGTCACNSNNSIYMAYRYRLASGVETVAVDGRTSQPHTYIKKGTNQAVSGAWLHGDDRSGGMGFIKVTYTNRVITEPFAQCVAHAGKECYSDLNCVANSTCKTGICSCDLGFTKKTDGRCGSDYSKTCSINVPCADGLACSGSTCKCPQDSSQEYDIVQKKCRGLVHATCEDDSECQEYSVCEYNPKSGNKHCVCADGILQGPGLQCRILGPGGACSHNPTIDRCHEKLQCRDGVCACVDSSTAFHTKIRKCVGRVGSKCIPALWHEHEESKKKVCVDHAICEQPDSAFPGQCFCQIGYQFTADGLCTKG